MRLLGESKQLRAPQAGARAAEIEGHVAGRACTASWRRCLIVALRLSYRSQASDCPRDHNAATPPGWSWIANPLVRKGPRRQEAGCPGWVPTVGAGLRGHAALGPGAS